MSDIYELRVIDCYQREKRPDVIATFHQLERGLVALWQNFLLESIDANGEPTPWEFELTGLDPASADIPVPSSAANAPNSLQHALRAPDPTPSTAVPVVSRISIPRFDQDSLAHLFAVRNTEDFYQLVVAEHMTMLFAFSFQRLRNLVMVPTRVRLALQRVCKFVGVEPTFEQRPTGWSARNANVEVHVDRGDYVPSGGYDSDVTIYNIVVAGYRRGERAVGVRYVVEDVAQAGWYERLDCDDNETAAAFAATKTLV